MVGFLFALEGCKISILTWTFHIIVNNDCLSHCLSLRDLNYNDLQEFPVAIRTLSKLQELWVHTHTKTHLPGMTIMVALSQVIPLSDFNVALGYNLSHPQQVLPAHIRTHLSAHTHSHMHAQARKRTHTHTQCFSSASTDVPQCAYVSQIQRMCACLHLIYPKKFFSCATTGATWGHTV